MTIATNMAGRGVDIKLGGEIQETIIADVRKALARRDTDPYGMTQSENGGQALAEIGEDAYPPFEGSIHTLPELPG